MSENTQNNNQQMIVIALVVIAALLAAIVGVVVYQTTKQVPAPVGTVEANGAVPGVTAPGTTPGQASPPAADAPFDAKTATKVPAGMTPEVLVKTYLDDVIAGKFTEAYAFLPVGNSYGSAASFESQVKPYGITKGNMGKPVTSGDSMTIAAEQVTPQMPITYTWTFKKVGGDWFVASRTMGGSVK